MKFKIKTFEENGKAFTHLYMNDVDISESVIGFRIVGDEAKPLHISIDCFGDIDFESADLQKVNQTKDGTYWRYRYIEQRTTPKETKRKGLLQRLLHKD